MIEPENNIRKHCNVLFSLTLYGCKKEEQGRPLSYNKGVYEGNPDSSLDENSVIILKQRTSHGIWTGF